MNSEGFLIGWCDKCKRPVRTEQKRQLHPRLLTWQHIDCPAPLVRVREPEPPKPAA